MTFPIESTTPSLYRFRLVTDNRDIICNPEPLEWKSGQLEIKRDLKVGGVFSTFQLDSLTFIGNGGELLKELFGLFEVNAKCDLIVEWFDYSIREYVEFPSRFNINFSLYETVKVGRTVSGVKVKAINSSFQTLLDNRSGVDIDLKKLKSIGGKTIQDWPTLLKILSYDQTNIFNFARMDMPDEYYSLPRITTGPCYHSIPLNIVQSDFPDEVKSVPFKTRLTDYTLIQPFFENAVFDHTLIIKYGINVDVTDKNTGSDPWEIKIIQSNATMSEVTTHELGSFGSENGNVFFGSSVTIDLKKGESLRLMIRTGNVEDIAAVVGLSSIEITQEIIASPARKTEGLPIYETIERTLQHILDIQYPFYSELFGRTDTIYNNKGQKYDTENQLRFAHVQSGLHLRGLKLMDESIPFPVKFDDLMKCIQAIWNIGYGFEQLPGESYERFRIESYEHFFKNEQSIDLSSKIRPGDIVSAVMPELIPLSIKSGFDNYEYLEINGRAEPNTTNERTSIMNTDAKYNCISPLRGDTKGILSALATEADTKDTKGDNQMFIVKTQRSDLTYLTGFGWTLKLGKGWKPERGENITIEDSTSIFRDDLLNRYFTPSRMLKRNANRIKSGMVKFPSSVLTFQKSDKLQGLKTTGEGYTITENEDIFVSDLTNPIYRPMRHTVECDFDLTDLQTLMQNKNGYIKFSDNISGYLLHLKKKNNEAKAEISIIERYE